jgi:hypothetical protein
LNIEVRSIKFSSVSSGKSSGGFFVSVVLDEADSLLVKMLALNEFSVFGEEGLEGFFVGVHGDSSNEELNLTFVFGVSGDGGNSFDGSGGLLSGGLLSVGAGAGSGLLGSLLLGLLTLARVRSGVRAGAGAGSGLLGSFLSGGNDLDILLRRAVAGVRDNGLLGSLSGGSFLLGCGFLLG